MGSHYARARRGQVIGLLTSILLSACSIQETASGALASPDQAAFERDVYPILMRDCGFNECHGGELRPFRVVGPGRARLDGDPSDPDLLRREKQLSYQRALSMLQLAPGQTLFDARLLQKPLDMRFGGDRHGGVDRLGRDVFLSQQDVRYRTLLYWALGAPIASGAVSGMDALDTADAGAPATNGPDGPAGAVLP